MGPSPLQVGFIRNFAKAALTRNFYRSISQSIKYNNALKYYSKLSSNEEKKVNRINSIVTNIMMKIQKEIVCLVANTIFRSL